MPHVCHKGQKTLVTDIVFKSILVMLLLLCILSLLSKSESVRLNIIHVNDIHAHFEEVNQDLGRCHQNQVCYGGAARMFSKIRELTDLSPNNTLVLNAGDYYQGTIWYTILKYQPVVALANMLNYTAYTLGNHDFDDGIQGLVPFMKNTNFPILACNIDTSQEPEFAKFLKPSIVVNVSGTKVGIIGYITPHTLNISHTGNLVFKSEITSVKLESQRLKNQGIGIIIALGHSGYHLDKYLARDVPLVDLVVGGHSHTFLYSGPNPPDHPEGPYPTYITQPSGKVVPIVQVGSYSKYLGYLQLDFDTDGDIKKPIKTNGILQAKPILLDQNVPKNPKVKEVMKPFLAKLQKYKKVIGYTNVFLSRRSGQECNLGDLITDAFRNLTNTDLAFINGGGIRSVISKGTITIEDVIGK